MGVVACCFFAVMCSVKLGIAVAKLVVACSNRKCGLSIGAIKQLVWAQVGSAASLSF